MTATWDLDAIGRMYDEEKANIAEMRDPLAPEEVYDAWPETEEIDVDAITPPPAPAPRPDEATVVPRRPWHARLLALLTGS
jgi:hypothetical protein